jgi:hypothetical protein
MSFLGQPDPNILRNNKSGFDSRNVDVSKLKYIKFHEDTALSKQSLKIEKKLLLELNNIMKFFADNYAGDMDPFNYRNIYENFKRDMEIQVTNIIRSYVTKIYTFTTEYVADSLAVSGFLTKSDIDVIEELTNSFVERFFGRIRNALETGVQKFYNSLTDVFIPASFNQNKEDIDNNEEQLNVLVKNIERSQSYMFSSLAILIINQTLNKATLLKTRKIILNDGTLNQNPVFQAAIDDLDSAEIEAMLNDIPIKKNKRIKTQNFYYIWKTAQDDRVCDDYCLPLEDEVFTLLDPFIPEPETDTHYNCRCRLMLLYV